MAEVGKAFVDVVFDKSQISSNLSTSVDGAATQSSGAVASSFKRLAGIAVAAFASVQIFDFFKGALADAQEANKIAAQTEAVIKSTGAAAGLTAQQFSDLAESIALKTGIDDEQIQSAENLLATFTNIKDVAGEGNDIFSQATQTMVDMGAALGQDASSSAIQLGKALNDPIAGISALTRVGVTFTKEQKDLIKSLVESGDVMGAQKVILAELSKEFGGSAEAQATAAGKFGVVWGNIKEDLGNALVPILENLATWASENLPAAITTMGEAFHWLRDNVLPVIVQIVESVQAMIAWIQENVVPVIRTVVEFVAEQWQNLSDWTREHWDAISEAIDHVLNVIEDIVNAVIIVIKKAWELFGDDILKVLTAVWDEVVAVIDAAVNIIKGVIEFFIALINGDWSAAWDALKNIVGTAIGLIVDSVENVLSTIEATIGGIFDGAKTLVSTAIDAIVSFVQGLPMRLLEKAQELLDAGADLGGKILEGLGNGLSGIVGFLGDIASAVFEAFKDAWNGVVDLIVSGMQMAVDAADWALGPWVNFSDTLASEVFSFAYLHEGGFVPGPAGSDVPAMLQAGEFVLSRDMIDNLGSDPMQSSGGGWQGDVIVNNPVPEEASETVPRQLRNLQWLMAAA